MQLLQCSINDLDVTSNIDAATLSTSGLATLNTVAAITNSLDVAGHQSKKTQQNLQRPTNGALIVFEVQVLLKT
jgi:hypothetical protein